MLVVIAVMGGVAPGLVVVEMGVLDVVKLELVTVASD